MKKIIIAMAAIAAFTMASCNKEQLIEPEKNTTLTEGNCIITASTESSLTKTALQGNDTDGYEVVWSAGDSFKIKGGETFTLIQGAGTTSGTFQGNLPDYNGWFTAYYPSSYDGSNWPTEQTYTEGNGITGSPMEAGFSCSKGNIVGGKAEFKNVGGILRLTLKGTATIKYIKVSADGLDEITLNCGSGVSLDADGTAFHIAMPKGNYSGVSISIWTIGFDNCTKTLKEGRNLVINKSEITTATFTASFPSPTSTDPLPGEFSVAAGRQVCFSRGNLRYTIGYDSGEWSFYDKQYKCGPLHGVDSKEISLFTWGYNATQSINPIGSASNNVSVKSGDLSATQDWGSVFGENSPWRTLTSAEWTYLFEGRTDAADKYGYATVGGQKGLIILPDEFTDPMKNGGSGAFKPQSSTASSWTDNYYTLAGNWEAMEAAGAVFLPAAGRRGGDSIATGSNEQGHYWSSSAADSDKAYFVYFNYNSFDPAYSWSRGAGCSVRLVTDLYTVTFDMNGKTGTAPESLKSLKSGTKITKPSDAIADGFLFAGWYKDKDCTKLWNFASDVVTDNITLYAAWIELPNDALPGLFSVSTDKQVFFSRGNLYHEGDDFFGFEENQWDFNGKDYTVKTAHISHFMWSKNAEETYKLVYSDQSPTVGDVLFTNYDQTHPNPDFTVAGQKGKWRTLSSSEWDYLLFTRTFNDATGPGDTFVQATINSIDGIVIFCDGYIGPKTDLTEIPEGCLFLPMAGGRTGYGNNAFTINYSGCFYWASDNNGNLHAYSVCYYDPDYVMTLYIERSYRSDAYAVRLVTDCE